MPKNSEGLIRLLINRSTLVHVIPVARLVFNKLLDVLVVEVPVCDEHLLHALFFRETRNIVRGCEISWRIKAYNTEPAREIQIVWTVCDRAILTCR